MNQRKYHLKNKDERYKKSREYVLKNKDKVQEYMKKYKKEYMLKNADKIKESTRKYNSIQVEELTDTYIKQLLTNGNSLWAKDIPKWLVEAKRDELNMKRIIKKEK